MTASTEDVAGIASLPALVRWLGAATFVISVPLFLVAMNVRQVTNDLSFYERGFARYGVAQRTGLTPEQLREVAAAFIAYFAGPDRSLDVEVELGGSRRPLFNQREIDHMVDVHHLMTWVRRIQIGAGVVLLLVPLVAFAAGRFDAVGALGKLCLFGGGLTILVLLLLGALSLVDFSQAFVTFHHLAFTNDLWVLDPSRDYLIMLFPEGFWFDATMRIALLTAIEGAAVAGLGLVLTFWGSRL